MTTPENAANTNAAPDLNNDLDAEAVQVLIARGRAAALAGNTRKTYDTGWRNWTQWALSKGLSAWPADPEDLQTWLATLIKRPRG